MATFKQFEDIDAWKRARELTREVYRVSSTGTFAKDFELRGQIRRASVSIMANIAEGFERGGKKELGQFLSIAKGSAGEVRSHLYVAADQSYLTKDDVEKLSRIVKDVSRIISGLMTYLKKSGIKGPKYKE
ncbi:MAG: four helix bundle protein [Planctomycetota bacterium]